ncbi:hypothetical protein PF010_g27488 [Phytophthora fragariae]|nr:hypothetical protein PF003_g3834 [Phytophthora fragariae]KAE8912755.1 hypothetical protein PF003_g3825 [Phytophthora fragariae]KAE9067368.1 hypothetical protein PF010_g27488 [Phytophthora fragariae]KAE9081151.1 hypothetical protein PF006_g27170 [Phytophthora fragariae]KAE9273504.1 hypothetical protein PF001_g27478 [Phytophthora fragariae]
MSPQGAEISVGCDAVLNFCANNYLGLSHKPAVEQAAADTLKERGFGLSSGHDRDDATLTDELKHASIIDGIRLCKAERHRFKHMNTTDLEQKLKDTQHCRTRLIATDGVFTMDGDVAPLQEIVTPQSVASLAAPYVSRRVASSTMT